jgi:hypothetical protein
MEKRRGRCGIKNNVVRIKFRYGYIGIIDSGKVIYEQASDSELNYSLLKGDLNINVSSKGWFHGDTTFSRIIINNKNYSQGKRGLNIVVYDKADKKVIDSVVFDIYKDLSVSRLKKF